MGPVLRLLAPVCVLACGDAEDPLEPACEVGTEGPSITLGAAQHACVHVELGPHASLTASATPGSAPSLTATHTHYRIKLVDDSRTGGLVRFSAPRPDAYVFYFAGDVTVTARDAAGERRCPVTRQELDGCAALPIGEVYELAADEALWLELGPAEDRRTTLVLEYYGAETQLFSHGSSP